MGPELTNFQVELEKGVTEALQHLGKPVTNRLVAGTSETYITGKVNDPYMTFWIYPDRAAFQVGRRYRAFERPGYEALPDLGCKFLEALVMAVQAPGTEPHAGGGGGLAGS